MSRQAAFPARRHVRLRRTVRSRTLGATTSPLSIERLETKVALAIDSFAGRPTEFVTLGDQLLFAAEDPMNGRELWVTDGTATGTRILKNIKDGKGSSYPRNLTVVGSTLYFTADNGTNGCELWKSDGTESGTVLVKDMRPGYEPMMMSPYDTSSAPSCLVAFGNLLFLSVDDGSTGRELWKSDGTGPGTVLVKDIVPGQGGSDAKPAFIAGTGSGARLFFEVSSGNQRGIWRTDGTADGTEPVNSESLGSEWTDDLQRFPHAQLPDGRVIFGTLTESYEIGTAYDTETMTAGVWVTDGSSVTNVRSTIGTFARPINGPTGFTRSGDAVYFAFDDGVSGMELWRTDGTTAVLVADINPGSEIPLNGTEPLPLESWPGDIVPLPNGGILFTAFDQTSGTELWTSDGTPGGTRLVKDIAPGSRTFRYTDPDGHAHVEVQPNGSRPVALTPFNGAFSFIANDSQIWRTDGTAAGTTLVKDVDGPSRPSGYFMGTATTFKNRLIVSTDHAKSGHGLWVSDGTAAGTVRMRNLVPTIMSVAVPAARTYRAGETLDFTATFSEPVAVNGTASLPITLGTKKVQAIAVPLQGTNPSKTLTFTYTVKAGEFDADGIVVGSPLVGAIKNAFKTSALRTFPVPATAAILVDAAGPVVTGVTPPTNAIYNFHGRPLLTFEVRFNEPVVVAGGTPLLELTIGAAKQNAMLAEQPNPTTLRFAYAVGVNDQKDVNGIGLLKSIKLNGATIRDGLGNDAVLGFKPPSLKKVWVDNGVAH